MAKVAEVAEVAEVAAVAAVAKAEVAAVVKAEVAAVAAAKARLAEVTALAKAEVAAVAAAKAAVGEAERRQRRTSEAALRVQAASPKTPAQLKASAAQTKAARQGGAGSHPDVPAHAPKAAGMLAFLRRQAKAAGDRDFDVEISRARSAELRREKRDATPGVGADTTATAKPAGGGFATAEDVAAWVRLAAVRTAKLAETKAAEQAAADRKQAEEKVEAERKQRALAKAVAMAADAKAAKDAEDAKVAKVAEAEWLQEAEAEAAAEAVVAEAQAKAQAAVQEEAAKEAAKAKVEHAADLQKRKEARLAGESAAAYAFPTKSSGMSAFLRRQAQTATDAAPAPGPRRQRKANFDPSLSSLENKLLASRKEKRRGGRRGAMQP